MFIMLQVHKVVIGIFLATALVLGQATPALQNARSEMLRHGDSEIASQFEYESGRGKLKVRSRGNASLRVEFSDQFGKERSFGLTGSLMNVIVIRPEIDREFAVICTVGGSSRQYRMTVVSIDAEFLRVIGVNALPTGLTYAPTISHVHGVTNLQVQEADSGKRKKWSWSHKAMRFILEK